MKKHLTFVLLVCTLNSFAQKKGSSFEIILGKEILKSEYSYSDAQIFGQNKLFFFILKSFSSNSFVI